MANRPAIVLARAAWAGIIVLGVTLGLTMAPAQAAEAIHLAGAWARATPPGQDSAAIYLTIDNIGRQGDVLLGVESPAARDASLHTTVQTDGIMSMHRLDTVTIPPSTAVAFEPGGRHIMLAGLHKPLAAGTTETLILRFVKAGPITTSVTIVGPRDDAPADVVVGHASRFAELGHRMLLEERDAGVVADLETIAPVDDAAFAAAMRDAESPLPLAAIVEWNRRHLAGGG